MTKILILGGGGLLGHKAYMTFSKEFETYVTFRNYDKKLRETKIFDKEKVFDNADAFNFDLNNNNGSLKDIFLKLKPDVVLNCIGIIKQQKDAMNPKLSIYINSLLPHLLAEFCGNINAKLIHISTDCVFSGSKGDYTEKDPSDAEDLYGKTKYLGEVNYGNVLTLRTSIIGHELFTNLSLVDWFLSQENKTVNGYENAVFTGFPTITFCRELVRIIKSYPDLKGLYNISSEEINKYALLNLIKKVYKTDIDIKPFMDFYCDRSLDSESYRTQTGFIPESWEEMINEMHEDKLKTNYNK